MSLRLISHCCALLMVLAVSACGGGSPTPSATATSQGGGTSTEVLDVQDYTLATGDRVMVTVFGQDNLSGERAVTGTGRVSIPLIGDIPALGLTTKELEDRIEQRFVEEQILVSPRIAVEVLTYRPFYILGEVGAPGQYEFQSGLTIIGAIARAGGFSYRANEDEFLLQRGGSNAQPIEVSGATQVLPGDIITVVERWF